MRYRSRLYYPANEPAHDIALKSISRPKSLDVRLDRTDPSEIFVETSGREWARFTLAPGGANEMMSLTLDEEEALAEHASLAFSRADNESRINRVQKRSTKVARSQGGRSDSTPTINHDKLGQIERSHVRQFETATMKKSISGKSLPIGATPTEHEPTWEEVEERERLRHLEIIRKNRSSE